VGESVTSLARVYTTTAGLVGYLAVSSDPSLHFPALKAHLAVVLRPPDGSPPAELPPALRKELVALLPQALAVERTAALLCALFDRLGTFVQLATPPTACAFFVLALEAEARKPLPASAALASVLGARFGCAGSTVQTRYKAAYDVAESWVSELPWAGAYHKVGARAKSARAKEGKRAVVAKSLKDAVAFQEEIWLKKVGAAQVTLVLEEDDGHESDSSAPSTVSSKRSVPDDDVAEDAVRAQHSRKRRKAASTEADVASSFLLSAVLASSSKTSRPDVRTKPEGDLCLLTHLLSADLCSLSLSVPTRLQILSSVRGGADHVLDEELFENDELEAFLRPPEEVDAFAHTVDWPDDSQTSATRLQSKSGPKPKAPKGSGRINMDRLARLLGEAGDDLDDDKADDIDAWDDLVGLGVSTLNQALAFDDDKDGDSENEHGGTAHGSAGVADEEVEEWRPASPGGGGGGEWCEF
jgi:transcription factor IIIB subunit 2